ncbi:MAG: GAF domain-containing protein, partial [Chloroflexota bacterium]
NDALLSTMKAISSLQLENVLSIVSTEARRLLDADTSRIYLVTPDEEWLQAAVIYPPSAEAVRVFTIKIGQGITGSVAQSGVGEVIPNTRHDRRAIYAPGTQAHDATAIFVPLKLRRRVLGVMSVNRQDLSRPYTDDDLELLTVIADQAAIVIENAQLLETERRKNKESSALHAVAMAGADAQSADDLIERVTQFIGQHLYPDSFGVLLLDEAGQILRTHDSYWGPKMTIPVTHSIAGQVVSSGQVFHTPDMTQEKGYFEADHFNVTPRMYAKLCVPLQIGSRIVGIINVESKQRQAFGEADQHLLQTLAQQLSVAIEKVRLFAAERMRATQQRMLAVASGTLLSALNLHDLWAALAAATRDILRAERTAVYLYAEDSGQLLCAFVDGFDPDYIDFFNQHAHHMPGSQVLETQEPLIINDVVHHPLYASVIHRIAAEGFQTAALFPLYSPKTKLGVMGVYRDNPSALFVDDDAVAGQTLAHIVTIALQNVQLFAEKHHALMREKRLNEIARILNVERSLPTVLSTVVRAATELVGAEAGALGLIVDEAVMVHYPYNLPERTQLHPLSRGRGLAWYVAETAVSIRLDEYASHPTADPHWVQLGIAAYLGVPVMSNDICLGTLSLFHLVPGRKFATRAQDLAEAIANQAGIAIQNLRLFEEAQQRANVLAVSLARQERLDRLKDVFIQNISHELRTPLGIILGHAELMESGILGELQPAQQDSVKIITRRVNMLTDLVNDLSVLLAAQTQEFRREPIHPKQLINAMMDDFKLQAEANDVHLEAEIESNLPWINGDPTHLRRVFDNLMSNAFKFTPAGGTVTFRVWREGEDVIFEVRDTGVGMPADQLDRIFERFYQVQQKAKKHPGGTGLGLALVKEIVEAHRGYVRVISEEGVGSTFEITLPGIELNIAEDEFIEIP